MSTTQKKLSTKPKTRSPEPTQQFQQPVQSQDGKQETVQEMLSKLEGDFNTKLASLNELREEHNKLRDKIVLAHDDMFRSYQKLMLTKENLLVNTVNAQQKELAKRSDSREDNVLPLVEEESDN